ncbi:MAG: alpha-E domain-containing protein [Acidobacteriaceae bacterium]
MLSRVADSLYWIGRYMERAENALHILDVNMNLMLEGSRITSEARWPMVMRALGSTAELPVADVDGTTRLLVFDTSNRASVARCITAARDNARQVRDELSSEQWQKLNRLYHDLGTMRALESDPMLSDAMQTVLEGIYLFKGVTDTTMTHGEGWHFIRAGRHMEGAMHMATLLEMYYRELFAMTDAFMDSSQYLEWIGLLRSCTAFESYCTVHTADVTPERILEFLLLNREFPHSLWYSIHSLVDALTCIQQDRRRGPAEELSRRAGKLRASLSFVQIGEIIAQDTASYLRHVLEECRAVQDLIYRLYISYSVDTALAL